MKNSAPKKSEIKKPISQLEELFAFQISGRGLPTPTREFVFYPSRKFRFDFAWPSHLLALEVEGGAWSSGRHTTGKGFSLDCEKYSLAALLGWRVLRATGEQVKSGQAIAWLEAAIRKEFAR